MFTKQKCCIVVLLAYACIISGGCGGEKFPPDMPKPYPVTITIIQAGTPLEEALISLTPADSANIWSAVGATDESGKAVLKTSGKYNGVVPGKYYVIVSKFEKSEKLVSLQGREIDEQAEKGENKMKTKVLGGYDLIDPKFSKFSPDAETIEVQAGKNEKTIDVGSAVRIERIIEIRL